MRILFCRVNQYLSTQKKLHIYIGGKEKILIRVKVNSNLKYYPIIWFVFNCHLESIKNENFMELGYASHVDSVKNWNCKLWKLYRRPTPLNLLS